ncbi:thiolase family protein [Fredinandcohnia onubensis]|uniref:thiolase family protein n=1 Tax=Fredinandcohnia onubensis TaxID=1571209 RepID=UPI000C0BC66E|nr:thiolase family protein [Fredinandcohnia onubensis]
MERVSIIGVGMTRFGRYPELTLRNLTRLSVEQALKDADVEKSEIEAIFFANSMAGFITGQECIRGQVSFWDSGLSGIPIYNVENACASGSTAFNLASMAVELGQYNTVLVVGTEKLYHEDRKKTFRALAAATDVEKTQAEQNNSVFMESYAKKAKKYMDQYGAKPIHLAKIASKNRFHASLNPLAQYRDRLSIEDILASPKVVDPLTRYMCSPIGDGSAAIVLSNRSVSNRKTLNKAVSIAASVIQSGSPNLEGGNSAVEKAVQKAYTIAGLDPSDVDLAEVHDATSPAELLLYESLGFAKRGEGIRLIGNGDTTLGGMIPVNTSGGLVSKGNPSGATGVAQICEIVWQLRGDAGERQVQSAKIGLTHNSGGRIGEDSAAVGIHIFKM